MSLINQMLKDLDERRASELEKGGISRHVRTLPPQRTFPWKGIVLSVAGALAGATVVGLIFTWRLSGNSNLAAPPAVPAVTAAPSIAPPLPAYPAVEQFRPVPGPAPVLAHKEPRQAVTRNADGQEPSLKLDRSIIVGEGGDHRSTPSPAVADRNEIRESAMASSHIDKQPRTPVIPEGSDAEYRRGMNLIKRGAAAEAALALRAALQIHPQHTAARQALLSLLVDQKQWADAQALGMEGLALDAKQVGWAMLVARLQVERGDMAAAVQTLDDHAQYAERNADYLGFHALLLQKSKRLPEAVDRYRAALALKPGEGRWWYGLGLVLEASQRPQDAKEAFAQARASGNLPADLAAAVEQKLRGQ